jgi:hypothetical protein
MSLSSFWKFWRVEVIWRPTRQTSLWAIAWDGFWPFTKPAVIDGVTYPGKPLKLPRTVHHAIQHMLPSAGLALVLQWAGLSGWLAGLLGAIAFGIVPHFIGVFVKRSYALDPRDCACDFWSSCLELSIVAVPGLWIFGLALWNIGYWTYVCWWASP